MRKEDIDIRREESGVRRVGRGERGKKEGTGETGEKRGTRRKQKIAFFSLKKSARG